MRQDLIKAMYFPNERPFLSLQKIRHAFLLFYKNTTFLSICRLNSVFNQFVKLLYGQERDPNSELINMVD